MKIETKRLLLKPANVSYTKMLLEYLTRNKEFFQPCAPTPPKDFYTFKRQKQLLNSKMRAFKEGKEVRFYIFKKTDLKRIVGDFGFFDIIKGPFLGCCLGYKMDRGESNKGYMAEALKAGIEYVFKKTKLHRIEANVMPRNEPSIRLMEKLGFENEGLSKKFLKINGKWKDHVHFVILNEKIE